MFTQPMIVKLLPLCLLSLLPAMPDARANVSVTNLFTDHMVLQRDIPCPVWGMADPGEKVAVKLGGSEGTATADAAGKWSVKLPAMKMNAAGQDLTITGKNTITIKDVLLGDVWVCSGQSNMEWALGSCNAAEDIAAANLPNVRRIKFPHVSLSKPTTNVPGKWEACTPQNAAGFTAVGFYFARRVQKETGVPIGLLDDSWGGTRIEPWIPVEGFELEPPLAKILEGVKKRDAAAAAAENNAPLDPGQPVALYNGMIYPVVPFGIKGALWYQGESNGGEGDEYYSKMRALIGGWRKVWGQGDFPFYFVQLANFEKDRNEPQGGDGWARVRMAQTKSLQVPHTGMAVIIDVGEAGDIHPKNKFDVGERLALWALHHDYGKKDVVPSGPIFKAATVEGGKIRVSFDYAANGLIVGKKEGRKPVEAVADGKLARFAIAGEDKKWVWADAVIDGAAVIVSSPEVPKPVAVRYAFSMNPEGANLYNKEGLPASPFRSDEW
jgi:sialate O-acetylesterase